MNKGDIVLIPFPFTDLSDSKYRPAVILIETEEDVTVCFITSQLRKQIDYDIILHPSEINGLKKNSLIRISKIATIDKDLIMGRLGKLSEDSLFKLNRNLIRILQLEK